jgi:hypothetical protein
MNINKIDNAFKSGLPSSKKVNGDNQFKQIFDKTLHKVDETTIPASVDYKTDVIKQGDKILNLLDDYARLLTDPGKSLKDIEPLVASIEKEVSLIEAEAADKVHHDHELEKFIKDLAVTANVAALKFYRGDYI